MQSDNYKKFLLNRMNSSQNIVEFIENSLVTEDEIAKHSLHKIMVCRWSDGDIDLFEALSNYFGVTFIPINFVKTNILTCFHTTSLALVLKILKLDFMFPHYQNMFSVDILLNDKTSSEFFDEKLTIDDIITYVVSHRFNEHCELNLTDFCNDPDFTSKKICFYKLSLLAHFKILMLRMGKDTKLLNLSNNNLSQIPQDVLNFFIKGDLIGVNLSNNNIPAISELQRISSKIEKLWVEGNPLCEDLDTITYIKQIVQKFPRLTELDGVPLNEQRLMIPFYKNYLETPNRKTKIVVEKFVSLYFAHYDLPHKRRKIEMFYDPLAQMTLTTDFPDNADSYAMHSRNFLNPTKRSTMLKHKRVYRKRASVAAVLAGLPPTTHDTTSFTVDVLKHDNKNLILVIDGVYIEKSATNSTERIIQFRRSFIFQIRTGNKEYSQYDIIHEMFSARLAPLEAAKNYFKYPIRHINQMNLINPDSDDQNTMCKAFIHLTQLKRSEAEAILKRNYWNMKEALQNFLYEFKNDKINEDRFLDDGYSDVSSPLDDEID